MIFRIKKSLELIKLRRCYSTDISNEHPLKGIRVLDLTRIVAGPYCTMILSDLGADIIKVEKPITGDESRNWKPPFVKNSEDSVYFMASNRNKRSICIDMKKGTKILHDLAKNCDILVENYIPGKLSEMKMGYDDLKRIAPRLIYCSITGYGSVGPYAKKPGYDVIAASMGGLLHITGEKNGPPSKPGVALTDISTGLYAHGAILAALYHREKTNRGQKIDVNLFSTQVACLINVGSNYLNAGQEATRWGTAHESIVPYEAFKTKSGYFTIGTGSDEQFKKLCEILNISHVAEDERFTTNQKRVENRDALIKILSDIIVTQGNSYWIELLKNAPFPCGPVNTIAEVFADPHVKEIGLVKTLAHPTAGEIQVVGPAVTFGEAKNTARTAPPLLGQHTNEILQSILGYDANFIEKLINDKVVQ